jgi:phospholipid-binding lipoprotein MlaA
VKSDVGTWSSRFVMLLFLVSCVALAGCAVRGGGAELRAGADVAAASLAPNAVDSAVPPEGEPAEATDYDPWEPFNERMFAFNQTLDRRVVKPAATGWSKVVPEPMRKGIENASRNVSMPGRFVNNLLQLKVEGALRELTGFVLNSTIGVAGLADVAKAEGVAPPSDEDTGQTLAVYGVGPGPYLVLPFFPPSTVRDAIGSAVDGLLDPVSLVLPFAGNVAKRAGTTVNDRSINLELSEEVEESILDVYSGVRNLYLQRRERAIRE